MLTRLAVRALHETGRPDEAEQCCEQAIDAPPEVGDRSDELALALGVLGTLSSSRRRGAGIASCSRARVRSREPADAVATANVVDQPRRDRARARAMFTRAVALHPRGARDRLVHRRHDHVVFCFGALSAAASASGDVRRAAILWGAAERLDRSRRDDVAERSGEEPRRPARSPTCSTTSRLPEGRALETEQAVELALRG